jgi:alkylhydroperoxidase/carboxymuconolactone decarboxylase family protein YurZ
VRRFLRKPLDKYIKVWYNIDTKEREELLMRVTKLIREYVEKSVKAMSKFAEPTPEEVEYKNLCDKLSNFRTSLDNQIKEIIIKAIADFRSENNIPEDVKIDISHYSATAPSAYCTKLADKARAAKRKRKEAQDEAINEILLSLELGADRKELEDMLNTLREEA